mmetsp:Transcript_47985/g.133847  ORF Transcript_47985/g.133847 Transcript_47985/m.133847 type:complete len:251 (-) Transcript_47985:360-1112(-)
MSNMPAMSQVKQLNDDGCLISLAQPPLFSMVSEHEDALFLNSTCFGVDSVFFNFLCAVHTGSNSITVLDVLALFILLASSAVNSFASPFGGRRKPLRSSSALTLCSRRSNRDTERCRWSTGFGSGHTEWLSPDHERRLAITADCPPPACQDRRLMMAGTLSMTKLCLPVARSMLLLLGRMREHLDDCFECLRDAATGDEDEEIISCSSDGFASWLDVVACIALFAASTLFKLVRFLRQSFGSSWFGLLVP